MIREAGIGPICAAYSLLSCLSAAVLDLRGEGFDDDCFILKHWLRDRHNLGRVLLVRNRNVQV